MIHSRVHGPIITESRVKHLRMTRKVLETLEANYFLPLKAINEEENPK